MLSNFWTNIAIQFSLLYAVTDNIVSQGHKSENAFQIELKRPRKSCLSKNYVKVIGFKLSATN